MIHRMSFTGDSEKWCVPTDLKDFHFQFGQKHFAALSNCFIKRVKQTVIDESILEDLLNILNYFEDELTRGTI